MGSRLAWVWLAWVWLACGDFRGLIASADLIHPVFFSRTEKEEQVGGLALEL